jgi:hypothetical protein
MAVHPNCSQKDCHGAFVATRAYGLYYTDTLVFDNHSDPEWERVGQTLDIKQFHWDTSNPQRLQVCLDFGLNGWLRYSTKYDDDNWHQIFTPTQLATIGGYEWVYPTWIEYKPNGWVYVATDALVNDFVTGVAFINYDYGDPSAWYVRLVAPTNPNSLSTQFRGSGSIHHQQRYSQNPYGAGIWWYGMNWTALKLSAAMYSLDEGNTWLPVDGSGWPDPIIYGVGGSDATETVPSKKYWNRAYYGHKISLTRFGMSSHSIKESDGVSYDKSGIHAPGAIDQHPAALWFNNYSYGQAYIAQPDATVWMTDDFEGAGPFAGPDHVPSWSYIQYPKRSDVTNPGFRISAIDGTINNEMLFGNGGNRVTPYNYDGHIVGTTINDFQDVYLKGGINREQQSPTSGAIYYKCGGVSKQGIVVFDVPSPSDDPESSPTISGWPVYINCEGRELVADQSWDRLYVAAETTWAGGDGLWNQPLMFQFILSGDVYGSYFENRGFLAFLPFVVLGGNIYSGSYTYAGDLEAHTGAPIYHKPLFVGRFENSKQVYYNDDITGLGGWVLSGWPASGWQLVGAFGTERVSSIANNYTIEDDLTISHSQAVLWPTSLSGVPWTWEEPVSQPFTTGINTQLREGFDLWAGIETPDGSQPVRMINITLSGTGWYLRGGSLPTDVQINDIERGA